MEYMGNSTWWNQRFAGRDLALMPHEQCLENDLHYFTDKNKILDLACGDGRNAIYFARKGYQVTCVDFCEEALKRLKYFASKENLAITTKLVNLSTDFVLELTGNYDAIVINHYRLNPKLYQQLMSVLSGQGIIWVNGFREVPADNPYITKYDILQDEDFYAISSHILQNKNIYEVGQRKFVRYIWRK